MQSSNPVLSTNAFSGYRYAEERETMTMQGVVIKTSVLLLLVLVSAAWVWTKFYQSGSSPAAIAPWMIGGAIGGFVLALATAFKPAWAVITSPFYALLQGLFIGGISATFESSYPGIVVQATTLTFGTFIAMLLAYQSGFIRATENFKLGIVAATGGIALVYIASIALSFFGIKIPFISGGGWFGIGFSLFVVVIAALNFVLDFDFIEKAAKKGAPKSMEWYAGFALMVTLIWLYVEFLRLLSKLREQK